MEAGDVVAERFEVNQVAGSGGMGVVYRALNRMSGRRVAIKVMKGRDREERERFSREATSLADLVHPGIVGYVAHGTTKAGDPFLAMEWLEGESLADILRWKSLSVAQTIAVGLRVAEALSVLHKKGIVHRDLKPSNLLIVEGDLDRVKILDFGIVRVTDAVQTLTLTGAMLGTPGYMAPEQARGQKDVDARADVFALGCVLFKCLSGRSAFGGDDMLAVLLKVVLEEAPRVGELRADVPDALDALVTKMMAKSPADRPSDGAAVLAELRALAALEGQPSSRAQAGVPQIGASERRVVCLVLAKVMGERLVSDRPPLDTPDRVHLPSPLAVTGTVRIAGTPNSGIAKLDVASELTIPSFSARDRAIADVVAQFQGAVDVLADGSLLVTLMGAGAATDLAAKAAQCALAVRGLLGDSPMALVTGRGETATRMPMGEVIDRAVGLLNRSTGARGAEAEIRIDELTAGLLGPRFDVGGDRRGLTLRAQRDATAASRTLLGRPTPCVGRNRELAALAGYFDESASEPLSRVVLVTAPAGVGKSRVRHEFVRRIQQREPGVEVWIGRGDPMSAGAPFGMLAQVVARAAAVLEGEPRNVRQQKLRARFGRHLVGADLVRVTHFLCELVGASFPDDASVELRSARHDPIVMGDQMRRAWEDWLSAECEAQPVIIVLEDLHWGNLPTVKFIDAVLRNLATSPLLVLALARPEVHDVFPKLWADRDLQEMRLGELTRKGSERLVREVLGDQVSERTITRLVERAAGNAFYLEELIRAVVEGKGDQLPETVLAMVQARLEGLDAEARRVLRAASVFGQVFWRGGVAALLGGEQRTSRIAEWLSMLVDLELVTRRDQSRFPGEEQEYVFRHALVRDAAYAMLTDANRVLGHRLAGSWLEAAGERSGLVLAEHFERGGEPARAATCYVRAVEQALGGNDLEAAVSRSGRGIACGATGEDLGLLRLHQAEAHRWRGEFTEAEACALEAMQHLRRGGAAWHRAVGEGAIACGRLGHNEELVPLVRALREIGEGGEDGGPHVIALAQAAGVLLFAGMHDLAQELLDRIESIESDVTQNDPEVLGWIRRARATQVLLEGDPGGCLDLMEEAAKSFEHAGDLRSACGQRINVGYAYMTIGAYREAERALRDALAAAQRMGLHNATATARNNLGLALARQGVLDEARTVEGEAIRAATEQGDRRMEGASRAYLAIILALSNRFDAAEQEAREAARILEVVPPIQAYALGVLGHALLAQKRAAEALVSATEAMNVLSAMGALEEGESLVRLVHAEALLVTGNHGAGRVAIAEARERLLARAATIKDPRWRESFLRRVPENASLMALADAWVGPSARA